MCVVVVDVVEFDGLFGCDDGFCYCVEWCWYDDCDVVCWLVVEICGCVDVVVCGVVDFCVCVVVDDVVYGCVV